MEPQLTKTLERAATAAGARLGNIQMMDWRRGALAIRASLGFDARFLEAFRYVALTEPTICARAARTRKPVLVPNVFADPDFAPYHEIAREAGFESVLSTPMISRGNVFVGVLSLHFAEGHRSPEPLVTETFGIARETADALLG